MGGKTIGKVGIGVIGCGNISMTYLHNAKLFDGMELVACADISTDAAVVRAREVRDKSPERGCAIVGPRCRSGSQSDDSGGSFRCHHVGTICRQARVHEKPLATSAAEGRRLLREAGQRGLLLGSAPDTFLGAAGRRARRLMDEGAIGRAVTGTAFMMSRGMEHWHPNPQFYYQPGGGPVFDMGPYYLTMLVNLLGPVKRVAAMATTGQGERLITAEGPFRNATFAVGTPTSVLSLLEFHCGAIVNFGASWDVFRHSNHPIELHGTEGSLRLPDPDTFGGTVSLSERGGEWRDFCSEGELYGALNWPFNAPDRANYRMLGVADLVRSLAEGRTPRASGELAVHVLEIMEAILEAGQSQSAIDIPGTIVQPPLLSEDEARSFVTRGGI